MVGKSSRTNSKNEVTWGENNRPLSFKGTRYEAFTMKTHKNAIIKGADISKCQPLIIDPQTSPSRRTLITLF